MKNLDPYQQHRKLGWLTSHSLVCCVFIFLIFGGRLNAQDFNIEKAEISKVGSKKTWFLKTNPLSYLQGSIPLLAEYNLGIEVVAKPRLSYQAHFSYINKSFLFNALAIDSSSTLDPTSIRFDGLRVQGQIRYYIVKFNGTNDWDTKHIPAGYFIALHGSYAVATLRFKSQSYPRDDYANLSINALAGIHVITKQNLGIEFYTGLGYKKNTIQSIDYQSTRTNRNLTDMGVTPYYSSNFKFTFGMNLIFGLF